MLLAVSLALALKPEKESTRAVRLDSGVIGRVIASPCHPGPVVSGVEYPPCPGHYGPVRILSGRDARVIAEGHTDKEGHFRIALPPGRYVVDPGDDEVDYLVNAKRVVANEGWVTVREGSFARVFVEYATGLCC
jgi:hypothetical protein